MQLLLSRFICYYYFSDFQILKLMLKSWKWTISFFVSEYILLSSINPNTHPHLHLRRLHQQYTDTNNHTKVMIAWSSAKWSSVSAFVISDYNFIIFNASWITIISPESEPNLELKNFHSRIIFFVRSLLCCKKFQVQQVFSKMITSLVSKDFRKFQNLMSFLRLQ